MSRGKTQKQDPLDLSPSFASSGRTEEEALRTCPQPLRPQGVVVEDRETVEGPDLPRLEEGP